MFSKKSSTSKPKFLNLHTLAPITVAVLTVYSSAASADYVLTNGVSLTGTNPAVDIYQTDKNLTLTNLSGAALYKVALRGYVWVESIHQIPSGRLGNGMRILEQIS